MILGHTFYFALPFLDNPIWALDTIQNSLSMEAVKQGLFSVDSFFFLSGLLVSYLFLMKRNEVKNASSLVFWMKIIGHRQGLLLLIPSNPSLNDTLNPWPQVPQAAPSLLGSHPPAGAAPLLHLLRHSPPLSLVGTTRDTVL